MSLTSDEVSVAAVTSDQFSA